MTSSKPLLARIASRLRRWLRGAPEAPAPEPPIADDNLLASLKQADAPAPGLAAGMTLIGHPYEILGRSEDIRTGACACDAADIPFSLVNVYGEYGKERSAHHRDFPFFHLVGQHRRHKANLLFLNADEIPEAARVLDHALFTGPYNIGCYAWELSHFPAPWTKTFDLLHEIWAPTRFIQDAIREQAAIPVEYMPFAIDPGPAGTQDRAAFGIPADKFVFLFFFDFRSYVQRKNPWAVLEAFMKAFPEDSPAPVHLVIKVNGQQDKPEDFAALREQAGATSSRIQLIERTLDDQDIKALINASDCFVSLHRAEGFGRGLAEAMYYGKPVIATNYSGNTDFMHPDNACLVDYELIDVGPDNYPFGNGQHWADADTDQAAAWMRKLVDEADYARDVGKRAAAYIREHHSYAAVGAAYRERLERLSLL